MVVVLMILLTLSTRV